MDTNNQKVKRTSLPTGKRSRDWQSPVLRRAHRLAEMPVASITSIALSYGSALDLRVLGVGEAICRSRKEAEKVRVIQKNIKRLRKQLANGQTSKGAKE